jgi:glutathione S-transferase
MLKLYAFPTCPYCQKVRDAFAELGLEYHEIDASPGTPGNEELLKLGGKGQVPFLVDEENNVQMYESDDIIAYVRENSEAAGE